MMLCRKAGICFVKALLISSLIPGLRMLKKSLKDWDFSHFGHCQSTIKSLQEQIGLLQSQPQSDVVVSQ